jgi:hypothetical protein
MWMWLACELRRAWIWIACCATALGVVLSRLYLGAHDVQDVLAGAALGALTLLVFARIKDRAWFWQSDARWGAGLLVLAMTAALLAWPDQGRAPDYVPMIAGWAVAAILLRPVEQRMLGFSVSPLWWRKVLALVLGAAVFELLHKALTSAGASLGMTPLIWQTLQGLVIGCFVTVLVPWMLARFGLVSARQA